MEMLSVVGNVRCTHFTPATFLSSAEWIDSEPYLWCSEFRRQVLGWGSRRSGPGRAGKELLCAIPWSSRGLGHNA